MNAFRCILILANDLKGFIFGLIRPAYAKFCFCNYQNTDENVRDFLEPKILIINLSRLYHEIIILK